MDCKKIRILGAALLITLWASLTACAWFLPANDFSEAERRPLEQMPPVTADTLLNGSFMANFEDAALDQFPLRDPFRTLKSVFHYYGLQQKDNNGIYIEDGYAAKLEYPLNLSSVKYVCSRFNYVYDTYLKDTGSKITFVPVPDKGYYLAQPNGYPSMDYDAMFSVLRESLPWANFVDITDCLTQQDYYFTDTHWRQENLIPAAQKITKALGVSQPKEDDFEKIPVGRPFYGVYYGQAALPMKPDTMYLLENDTLRNCKVYNYEKQETADVYNMEKLSSKDLYDVYLSGASFLLTIDNPNATTDKELIIFRDSFGSSMTPLLLSEYKTVTLVDLRYISSKMLDQFIQFKGQDVLFLYSTLVLNNGSTIK